MLDFHGASLEALQNVIFQAQDMRRSCSNLGIQIMQDHIISLAEYEIRRRERKEVSSSGEARCEHAWIDVTTWGDMVPKATCGRCGAQQ